MPYVLLARRDLTSTAKLVLAYLAHRSGLKDVAWPSVRRIADTIGVGERSVRRAVHQLITAGDLSIEQRLNGERNRYRVHMEIADKMAALSPDTQTRSAAIVAAVRLQKRGHNGRSGGQNARASAAKMPAQDETNDPLLKTPPYPPWPQLLDTEEFRKVFGEWVEYRRERRKPLMASTIKRQLAKLESMGHDDAIARIDRTITQGWLGLFGPQHGDGPAHRDGHHPSRVAPNPGKYDNVRTVTVRSGGA